MLIKMKLHSFGEMPTKDGTYITINTKTKTINEFHYTVEGGWNTSRSHDGKINPNTAISPDSPRDVWGFDGWLTAIQPNPYSWKERLEEIAEEVYWTHKNDPYFRGEKYFDENAEEAYNAVDELYSIMQKAVEFAETAEVNGCSF